MFSIPMYVELDETKQADHDIALGHSPSHENATISRTYDAVVHFNVPLKRRKDFKVWLDEMFEIVSAFKGYVVRYVQQVDSNVEYVQFMVITVFDSLPLFESWMSSSI